jgi:hypothetical protein
MVGFMRRIVPTHLSMLLRRLPDRYAWWEENERQIRAELGKNITILRDMSATVVSMSIR